MECKVCKKESKEMKTCSQCKAVHYCSITCQKQDWNLGGHKLGCQKNPKVFSPTTKEIEPINQFQLSDDDLTSLINLIKNQFVDIPKIMALVDPNKAIEFKKRNQMAHMEHHSDSVNCCSL